jgi:hypothetical protein
MTYKIKLTGKGGKSIKSKTSFKTRAEAQKVIKMTKKIPYYRKAVKKYTIVKTGKK